MQSLVIPAASITEETWRHIFTGIDCRRLLTSSAPDSRCVVHWHLLKPARAREPAIFEVHLWYLSLNNYLMYQIAPKNIEI